MLHALILLGLISCPGHSLFIVMAKVQDKWRPEMPLKAYAWNWSLSFPCIFNWPK